MDIPENMPPSNEMAKADNCLVIKFTNNNFVQNIEITGIVYFSFDTNSAEYQGLDKDHMKTVIETNFGKEARKTNTFKDKQDLDNISKPKDGDNPKRCSIV